MCIGSRPSGPPRNVEAEQQQKEQEERQTEEKRVGRQEALDKKVTRLRGGSGRRSLITSSRGGMGYYSEYT